MFSSVAVYSMSIVNRKAAVAPRPHRAIGMFVGMDPTLTHPPPLAASTLGETRGGGGEMSGTKCKFMLTSGAENMFSATRGTLIFHKVK